MKTLKSLPKTLKFITLLIAFIIIGCSSEQEIFPKANKSKANEITFRQFLKETGIKNFKTNIQVIPTNQFARNADGTYELSDFIIDTDLVKRLVVDQKTTYTFLARPKIIREFSIFNLTYFFKNNEWQTSIVELKPTSTNWEELKNNSTIKFNGEIKNVANSDVSIYTVGNCTVIAVYDLHCTDPGQCLGEGGSCDGCSLCLSLELFTFCAEDFNLFTAPAEHPYTGGGGGGGHDDDTEIPPTFIDPSGYIFDPNLPAIGQDYIDIENATELWNNLSAGFDSQREWTNEYPNEYCEIVETYLQNFPKISIEEAKEIIDKMIAQPELYPSPKALLLENLIDDTELDDCGKGIMSELKNLQNHDMAEVIAKLDDPNSLYKYRVLSGTPSDPFHHASTNWETPTPTSTLAIPYKYKTTVRTQLTQNGTRLGVAFILIHEMVHAYFLSLIDDCYQAGQCEQLQAFPAVYNYYVAHKTDGALTNNLAQHQEISLSYVEIIAAALKEYDNASHPDEVYQDLAWGGLKDTPAFNALPEEQRNRILRRNDAECFNQPQYDNFGTTILTSPVSTPCP